MNENTEGTCVKHAASRVRRETQCVKRQTANGKRQGRGECGGRRAEGPPGTDLDKDGQPAVYCPVARDCSPTSSRITSQLFNQAPGSLLSSPLWARWFASDHVGSPAAVHAGPPPEWTPAPRPYPSSGGRIRGFGERIPVGCQKTVEAVKRDGTTWRVFFGLDA
jgi:hypothetical protein